jgi:hypothetical protein
MFIHGCFFVKGKISNAHVSDFNYKGGNRISIVFHHFGMKWNLFWKIKEKISIFLSKKFCLNAPQVVKSKSNKPFSLVTFK